MQVDVIFLTIIIIAVIAKYVYIFIAVIYSESRIVFWRNTNIIACVYRTISTIAFVLLQPDINDTGITGRFIFGRWVGNDLDGFNRRRLKRFKIIRQVFTSKRSGTAINKNLHPVFTAYGEVIVFINHNTRRFAQQFKRILPDAHADFPFAVTGEEFGIIACIALALLFMAIVLRALYLARRSEDPFCRLACVGLITLFGVQSVINMAVNVQLMPAKGMTLPFISYGGSSMISLGVALGFLLAVTRRRPRAEMSALWSEDAPVAAEPAGLPQAA